MDEQSQLSSNQPPPVTPAFSPAPKNQQSSGKITTVILVVIVLILAGGLGFAVMQVKKQQNDAKKSLDQKTAALDKRVEALEAPTKYVQEQIEKDKFQAVFLVGGQVYFGNITHIDDSSLTLETIYYLNSATFSKNETITGPNTSLVKLGSELHAPEDKMVIERKNVSFWENLKPDGQVAKAIADYQKSH